MELVRPDGNPLNSGTKLHEPESYRRVREQMEKRFVAIMQAFAKDMAPNDMGVETVVPDVDAIREHYGAEYANAVRKAKLIHPSLEMDERLVYNTIDAELRKLRLNQLLRTPLQEIKEGLVPFEFDLVGTSSWGDLWLAVNNAHWIAVAVSKETGVSTLWLGLGDPPKGLLQLLDERGREPICRQPNWTMNEVTLVIRGMRWQKVKRPEPKQLAEAREQRTSWFARRWN